MKRKPISIRLKDKLENAIRDEARKENRDLTNMIETLLIEAMKKKTGKDFR